MQTKVLSSLLALCISAAGALDAPAQKKKTTAKRSTTGGAAGGQVYQQFRWKDGRSARWISEQMPIKVYVAPGLTLDGFVDQQLGASVMNVDNTAGWPDLVKSVAANPEQMSNLPPANGFEQSHMQACLDGINQWKRFEKEGLFSYELTQDPGEADILVFWTHHFVNKLGLATFANDIRGYTAQYPLPLKPCLENPEAASRSMKPVVIYLRCSEQNNLPMPYEKLKASAAHEFGHALGILQHSNNPGDLMSVFYGRGTVSTNDAATIRHLYRINPDLLL